MNEELYDEDTATGDVPKETGIENETTDTTLGWKSKHTPGPWRVEYAANRFSVCAGDSEHFWRVGFSYSERNEANARLIADAPTVLAERDALREEVARLKAEKDALLSVCEAVKKEAGKLCADCHWQDYSVGPRNPEPCRECYVNMAYEEANKSPRVASGDVVDGNDIPEELL